MSHFRTVTAGIALAAAAILLFAAPAAAHDEVVSTDPPAGHDYATAPASVSLTFSGDVMTIGALVVVVDATGKDWVSGEPEILAGTVVVPLSEGMPAAGYEVRWRVVSSDGHPISGLIPFTVGGAAPMERIEAGAPVSATPDATAPDATSPAPAAPGTSSPEPVATESASMLRIALIGGGGAVVALALWAGITFLRRKKAAAPASTNESSDRKVQS